MTDWENKIRTAENYPNFLQLIELTLEPSSPASQSVYLSNNMNYFSPQEYRIKDVNSCLGSKKKADTYPKFKYMDSGTRVLRYKSWHLRSLAVCLVKYQIALCLVSSSVK